EPLAYLADEPQRLHDACARDNAVLHVETRCDAPQRAERSFAALPELLPFDLRLRHAHRARSLAVADLFNLCRLRLHLFLQAFPLDQQRRGAIAMIARMDVILNGL